MPGWGEASLLVVVVRLPAAQRRRLPRPDGWRGGGRRRGGRGDLLQDRVAGQPLALWAGAFLALLREGRQGEREEMAGGGGGRGGGGEMGVSVSDRQHSD